MKGRRNKGYGNEPCRDINTNGLQKLVAVIQQFREAPYHMVVQSSTNELEIISPCHTNGHSSSTHLNVVVTNKELAPRLEARAKLTWTYRFSDTV